MKILTEKAVYGFGCRTSNEQYVRLQFVIVSYIAYLPEKKDILGVKIRTAQVIHVQLVMSSLLIQNWAWMPDWERCRIQAYSWTRMKVLWSQQMKLNDWTEKLKERYIQLILTVLNNLPFARVTPSLEIFNIFSI